MKLDEYQALSRRTQNHELTSEQRLLHALLGLVSEVGEICGIYQKQFQGHEVCEDKVVDEAGDAMWFLSELADSLCVRMSHIAKGNVDKLRKRYPEGFDTDRSVNREEYQ